MQREKLDQEIRFKAELSKLQQEKAELEKLLEERTAPGNANLERESKPDDIQRLIEYSNAKVVLVGDTGVGKSGLALVLTNQPFAPTESTHGRRVLRFENNEVELPNGRKEIQETILWDLAGQPGYRLIHQLDLQGLAVAIIIFDARSDTNPISGIAHWVKAFQQIEASQGDLAPHIKKFLVAARTDRGQINMTREQIYQFQ